MYRTEKSAPSPRSIEKINQRKSTMKNSLKQLFRTPVKTGLFCMIFLFGTVLFTVGLNLWLEISEKIKAADETFVTIGMAEQKEQSTVMEQWWDAGLKDYSYRETEVYGEYLTPDILENLDVEYISKPRQRPYFGAVSPGNLTGGELTDESVTGSSLTEIRALEDCVPDHPVPVEVVRVLWGTRSLLGKKIYFCDHRTEHPDPMEAGNTYIAYIGMNPLNADKHEDFDGIEYMPLRLYENQDRLWYETGDGAYEADDRSYEKGDGSYEAGDGFYETGDGSYEKGDGFYETGEGARWEKIAGMLKTCREDMLPVTPVTDLQLLQPFHNGDAVLVQGREIAPEEYEDGGKVCLIPQNFAQKNDLRVGDSLPLQFYFADYKYPLCQVASGSGGMDMEAMDADGNVLAPFWKGEYRIVGIYSYPVALTNDPHAFVNNQIFVPEHSVAGDFQDHIAARGPMQAYNTSFRIKNGSAGTFLEEFSKIPESSLLEIEFDDGGYEAFASKIKNTRIVAAALFFAGLALLLATTAFLMYFMILKEKRRTAVQLALGMTRHQCTLSLLGGILVLTAVCARAGAALGMQMSHAVQEAAESKEEGFSTAYTKGVASDKGYGEDGALPDGGDGAGRAVLPENSGRHPWTLAYLVAVCETGIVWLLALFCINKNLCTAPILVLSGKEEE